MSNFKMVTDECNRLASDNNYLNRLSPRAAFELGFHEGFLFCTRKDYEALVKSLCEMKGKGN